MQVGASAFTAHQQVFVVRIEGLGSLVQLIEIITKE
jgi:hypothetical protein